MAVSTISSALGKTGGINPESQKVINWLNGNRSAEEMIGEYFGLRKEIIYSDDGKQVEGMINEFKDHAILKQKKVHFAPYFAEKGMTEEMYYKVIPREYVYVPTNKEVILNTTENEQSDIVSTGELEAEPKLPSTRGRVGKNKK